MADPNLRQKVRHTEASARREVGSPLSGVACPDLILRGTGLRILRQDNQSGATTRIALCAGLRLLGKLLKVRAMITKAFTMSLGSPFPRASAARRAQLRRIILRQ